MSTNKTTLGYCQSSESPVSTGGLYPKYIHKGNGILSDHTLWGFLGLIEPETLGTAVKSNAGDNRAWGTKTCLSDATGDLSCFRCTMANPSKAAAEETKASLIKKGSHKGGNGPGSEALEEMHKGGCWPIPGEQQHVPDGHTSLSRTTRENTRLTPLRQTGPLPP